MLYYEQGVVTECVEVFRNDMRGSIPWENADFVIVYEKGVN
jgi:hypothetical protein